LTGTDDSGSSRELLQVRPSIPAAAQHPAGSLQAALSPKSLNCQRVSTALLAMLADRIAHARCAGESGRSSGRRHAAAGGTGKKHRGWHAQPARPEERPQAGGAVEPVHRQSRGARCGKCIAIRPQELLSIVRLAARVPGCSIQSQQVRVLRASCRLAAKRSMCRNQPSVQPFLCPLNRQSQRRLGQQLAAELQALSLGTRHFSGSERTKCASTAFQVWAAQAYWLHLRCLHAGWRCQTQPGKCIVVHQT